jgi:CheY-like chemotaxis protein
MRLLLADDNQMNVELFSAALEKYDLVVAHDGAQAVERGLQGKFDMYLLDIQMPRMDGYEVCRTLRAKGVRVPIIALSAAAMPADIQKGRAAGFDAYLTKPISPHDLVSAVQEHTRSAA